MICQFCGSNHDVIELTNLDHGNPAHKICQNCLKYAFYCISCKKVHVKGISTKEGRVCLTCAGDNKLCLHCGKLCELNKHGLCTTCNRKARRCSCCSKRVVDTQAKADGSVICLECTSKFVFCVGCNLYHEPADTVYKLRMCKTCAANTYTCGICGITKIKGRMQHFNEKLGYICKEHINPTTCGVCEQAAQSCIVHKFTDQIAGDICSIYTCSTCHQSGKIGYIKRYGYKPSPKCKGEGPLYLGIENEVSFGGDHHPVIECYNLTEVDKNEEHWYIKSDSSVDHGFEIVTHPMSFEYIQTRFPVQALFNSTAPFRKSLTCGMHIHLSKSAFTNAQLFKFMSFIEKNQPFIEKIAERASNSYCSKIEKHTILSRALTKTGEQRDQVNMRPKYTVEVRIFQGATTVEQYMKNIEFCHALYKFTQIMSVASLTVDKFKDYVLKEQVIYPNLIKFLGM